MGMPLRSAESTVGKRIKIARNDPRLAHAMAKHELHRIETGHRRAVPAIFRQHTKNLRRAFSALRRAFGDLVLEQTIKRAIGSRAKGEVVLLYAEQGQGSTLILIRVQFNARHGGLQLPTTCGVQVNLHAIARVLQRSVGAADIHAAARVVGPHINLAGKLLETMLCDEKLPAIGGEIGIASAAGVLLFTVEPADGPPVKLLARTWIATDVAVDPQLGAAIAQSLTSPSGFTMIYGGTVYDVTVE